MQLRRSSGAVLAGAAMGFLAGLAANPARKLAVQGAEATSGDWVHELTAEHRAVEKALDALLGAGERETARRQGLLMKISYLLNKHAIEEEQVFPQLQAALSAAENAALTRRMNWEGLKLA